MSLSIGLKEKLYQYGTASGFVSTTNWLYDAGYTHNVVPMWKQSGVYEALYKSNGKKAKSIIGNLEDGISFMEEYPSLYKILNPKNGLGDYYSALEFLRGVCYACKEFPNARISVWA